jgi:hypothetical protein
MGWRAKGARTDKFKKEHVLSTKKSYTGSNLLARAAPHISTPGTAPHCCCPERKNDGATNHG